MRWREGGGHVSKETEEEEEETEKEEMEKTEETEKDERARRRFEIPKDTCCCIVARWTLTGGTFFRSGPDVYLQADTSLLNLSTLTLECP